MQIPVEKTTGPALYGSAIVGVDDVVRMDHCQSNLLRLAFVRISLSRIVTDSSQSRFDEIIIAVSSGDWLDVWC